MTHKLAYGNKRSATWTGYKAHLTETCDENSIHLITHVETTQAHISDTDQTQPIYEALASKALLPQEHVVDAGYVDGTLLVDSLEDFGIELIGPVRPDVSWQAKAPDGYDLGQFQIDSGKRNSSRGQPVSKVSVGHPQKMLGTPQPFVLSFLVLAVAFAQIEASVRKASGAKVNHTAPPS